MERQVADCKVIGARGLSPCSMATRARKMTLDADGVALSCGSGSA
jgi:hypothetical protein